MNELKQELEIQLDYAKDSKRALKLYGILDIIRAQCFFAQDKGGALYYYKNGVYHKGGEKSLAIAYKQILDHLYEGEGYTQHKMKEIISYFSIDAPLLLDRPKLDILNLQNGLYDCTTGKLGPHDPTYRTTIQLPVTYDPQATCPEWSKFISEVFSAEDTHVAYEIIAWLMTPNTDSQKSIVLLGTGANGKSVFLNGISNFLGKSNICNIPLQKLADRFTTTQLIGKLANISPDLPNTKISSTSEFKSLTGGDTLIGEYKNGAIFSFQPFARCVFACNELPETPDNSDGFYRRLNVITFDRQFKDDPTEGKRLNTVLATSSELSGLLIQCLKVLPKVVKQGISITAKMTEVIETHRKENDPVSVWLDECTSESRTDENDKVVDEYYIPSSELFQAYRQSGGGGQAAKSAMSFGRALKRYRATVEKKQKRIDGNVEWCYMGIRLKNDLDDINWQTSDVGHDKEELVQ